MRWADLGLLLVLGLAVFPAPTQAANLTIDFSWTFAPSPAGFPSASQYTASDRHYYYSFVVEEDSNLVDFEIEVTAGPNIDLYLFDETNYNAYANSQASTYIDDGTRENIRQASVNLNLLGFAAGRYYFVVDNGAAGVAPGDADVTFTASLLYFYTYTYQFVIPEQDYQDCQAVPLADRDDWNEMATVAEAPLRDFTNYLDTVKAEYGTWVPADDINIILAFIHAMPNVPIEVNEAPDETVRLPLETVYLRGGDADDAALLFVTLAKIQGYDVGILEFLDPPHTAGGVNTPTPGGYHWDLEGDQYYVAEATGLGWTLGLVPPDYEGDTAYVTKITGGATCDDIGANTDGPSTDGPTEPTGPAKPKKGLNKFVSDVVDKALLPIVIGLVLVLGTIGLIFERRQSNKRKARVQQAHRGYTDAPAAPWDAQPVVGQEAASAPWGYDPAAGLGPQEQERLRLLDERFSRGEIDQKTYMKAREQLFKK